MFVIAVEAPVHTSAAESNTVLLRSTASASYMETDDSPPSHERPRPIGREDNAAPSEGDHVFL